MITKLSNCDIDHQPNCPMISSQFPETDFDHRSLHQIEWQSHPVLKRRKQCFSCIRVVRGCPDDAAALALVGRSVGNLSHHMWLLLWPSASQKRRYMRGRCPTSPRDTKLLKIVLFSLCCPHNFLILPDFNFFCCIMRVASKYRKLWQRQIVRHSF